MSLIIKKPKQDLPLLLRPRVRKVFLDRCELTLEEATLLKKALAQRDAPLEALYLFRCSLNTECIKQLAEGLVYARSIKDVYLCSNPMSNDAVHALRDALLSQANIQVLHLWDNELKDQQAVILADGLRHNKTLQDFRCPRNYITGIGATAILEAASLSPTLVTLHLSFNRIRDGIADALSTAQLDTLVLDGNLLQNGSGADDIALGLSMNPSLRRLHLLRVGLGAEGCRAVASALRNNTHLEKLVLRRNDISKQNGLQQALQDNQTIREILVDDQYQHAAMDFSLEWNRAGRHIVADPDVDAALWPRVLSRVNERPDLLYSFLTSKPDLVQQEQRQQYGR